MGMSQQQKTSMPAGQLSVALSHSSQSTRMGQVVTQQSGGVTALSRGDSLVLQNLQDLPPVHPSLTAQGEHEAVGSVSRIWLTQVRERSFT
jgi:hypothetical protein